MRCACGEEVLKRPTDIITAKQIECAKCATKRRAANMPEKDKERLRKLAAEQKGIRKVPAEFTRLRRVCQCAKDRCTNSNSASYANYGGRGITFGFESASAMAHWLVDNLGYPNDGESLDRIDNNKGYEPGNIRWADNSVQANNKRAYRRTEQGERIRKLQELRPDFCYETLREFIIKGLSDDEIIKRERTTSGRPRVRH